MGCHSRPEGGVKDQHAVPSSSYSKSKLHAQLTSFVCPFNASSSLNVRAIASSRSDQVSVGIPAARIDRGLVRVSAMIRAGHGDELGGSLTMCSNPCQCEDPRT
jgi:hypothetical protein